MSIPLRILAIEDDPTDAVMVNHTLAKSGLEFEFKRVETEVDFRQEIELHPPDVILSDHGLPAFSGMAALAVARESCPKTPFIFVTGRTGLEPSMKATMEGVMGCVSKDRLSELADMIRRAGRGAWRRRLMRSCARLAARMGGMFQRRHARDTQFLG